MKKNELEKWARYRKLGKIKFILVFVLYFIFIINLANLVVSFIKGDFSYFSEGIITKIIIGGLTGAFAGLMTWLGNEREYSNHINNNNKL